MKKEYEDFVGALKKKLAEALDLKAENVIIEDEGGEEAASECKLYVPCKEHEDACELFGIYIKEVYEKYKNGMSVEELVKEMVSEIKKIEQAGYLDKVLDAIDYDKIKNKLFIRLVNAEKYKKELEHAVYKQIGDIALVLYMIVEEKNNRLASMKIRQEFLESWNRNKNHIFSEALLNTYYLSPPRIYRWEELLFNPGYDGENFMDLLGSIEIKKDAMGNCLSTTKRTNGAVAIFLPGVAGRIANLLDGSFYLVFTSIHEVMIHLDSTVDVESLENILEKTIAEATPKKDILTYKIYHYDRNTEAFTCVSS